MSSSENVLADKFGETQRRLADLEAKAQQLREKLIALGQSSIVGERYIVSVRPTAIRELDVDKLRKRLSEDQFERCFAAVEHVVVTVHERGSDE